MSTLRPDQSNPQPGEGLPRIRLRVRILGMVQGKRVKVRVMGLEERASRVRG
jgi:hypothetical protein